MKNLILFLTLLFVFQSCGNKELFSANKSNQEFQASSPQLSSATLCSLKTHIKAPVDVLVLFDNSPSSNAFNSTTRARLTSMIQGFVQDNFDFRIMVAPLAANSLADISSAVIFSNYPETITNASLQSKLRSTSSISSITFPVVSGSEQGIKRSFEIIQNNRSNGFFRGGVFTMVAVLTNGNDTSCSTSKGYVCSSADKAWYNSDIHKLTCLGHNSPYSPVSSSCSFSGLNAEMFRFITLSPKISERSGGCGTAGTFYHYASNEVYQNGVMSRAYSDTNPMYMDAAGSIIYNDARDFCDSSSDIFSHIRSSIKDVVIKHKYNRWPVASSNAQIDTSTIKIKLIGPTNNVIRELVNQTGVSNPSTGFSYDKNCTPSATDQCYTRFHPTPGEAFTGHLVKLHGSDELEFPNCLSVEYYAPNIEYKYVFLPYGTPNLSTLELYVDQIKVPQSDTNGWSYEGFKCPNQVNGNVINLPTPSSCGPMLKLNGTSIISTKQGSNVNVRVDYISSGI